MCRLTPPLICLLACGFVAVARPVNAQQAQPGKVTLANPPARQPEQRPAPQAMRVRAVDPALMKVLKDWHAKTRTIKKLQGQHERWTYEPVFAVAKCSKGKFYYESPDKGRMDLGPADPDELKKMDIDPAQPDVQVTEATTGKTYTIKQDKPEGWICDGTQILRIDESEKLYEVVPIPPEHRGTNIMDGPLPFLFGLPPEKALAKYNMTLKKSPPDGTIWLEATPLQRNDASLWQRADVLLDATTYLPIAVKLYDLKERGNQGITLFSFQNTKVNTINLIGWFPGGDPFKPNLFGYKAVKGPEAPPLQQPAKPIQQTGGEKAAPDAAASPKQAAMPSLIGLGHADAIALLQRLGIPKGNIKFQLGPVTDKAELRFHVVSQSPGPNEAITADGVVSVTVYVLEADRQKYEEEQRQKAAMPSK